MRQRVGDQQLPKVNNLPCIQDLVKVDIELRKQIGVERYGTPLQPHNGRDTLRDAYEEALDLAMYLRQAIYERDNPQRAASIDTRTYCAHRGCPGNHPAPVPNGTVQTIEVCC